MMCYRIKMYNIINCTVALLSYHNCCNYPTFWYDSDEGQDGDEEEICALHAGSSQQLRQAQLNNSCNNNNKDPVSQTTTATRYGHCSRT
jgi:hypothetical protein